ncbi:transposase [Paenibacillus larvae]|nr:transposase [Paenibacillus larvae]MDT2276934.1 transposase [Paenibacillus larvae]
MLPERYRKTNSVERLNEEVRRRNVSFASSQTVNPVIRLIGALLMEQDENGSRQEYLDMTEYS